jgi:hypothetical protein
LRALDLAVPVGALDEPHHQSAAAFAGDLFQRGDDAGPALLVGLHRQPQAAPWTQRRFARQPVQNLQRQHKPVGLFGIQREIDVGLGRQMRQPQHARIQLVPHTLFLRGFIAWRQRRQLDRNAVRVFRPGGNPADGGDRRGIGPLIAPGIVFGAGALAQHVEAA